MTVLVVALIFRRVITQTLSGHLARVKAGPLELEWERKVFEVKADLEITRPEPNPFRDRAERGSRPSPTAPGSPKAAVLLAHDRVTAQLGRLLEEAGEDEADLELLGSAGLARQAEGLGLIAEQTVQAVEGLTVLANLARFGRTDDVSVERAAEYEALADAVLFALSKETAT